MSRVMIQERESEPLSVEEFAVLEFTNDGDARSRRDRVGPVSVLTGKDSYYWAVAVAIAASDYDLVDEERIYWALARTFHRFRHDLKQRYSHLAFSKRGQELQTEQEFFRELLESFLEHLECPNLGFEEVLERTHSAFDSLVKKQLIEDPVELAAGGAILAIVGLIPYGFTTKTRRGRVVHRKVEAMYWSYERRVVRGEETTKFTCRLAKYLRAFKRAFVAAAQEEIDEPDETDS